MFGLKPMELVLIAIVLILAISLWDLKNSN